MIENPLYDYAWKRVRENNNSTMAVLGATGTGKSLASLKLAYDLDIDPKTGEHRFPLDASRVVFNVKDFYLFVQKRINGEVPVGSAVVFDEAAIDLSSDKHFMNVDIKNMRKVLQTFRSQRLITIMNFPVSLGFLAKPIRQMFDVILDARGVNFQEGFSVFVPHYFQTNTLTGKIYRHSPRGVDDNGKEYVMESIKIRKPPEELIKAYERKKKEFANNLLKETISFQEAKEKKVEKKTLGLKYYYDLVLKEPDLYFDKKNNRFSASPIQVRLGLSKSAAESLTATLNIDRRGSLILAKD
ncbi:MAG: ATP-binding protein [Magnetococcus sp. YQC-3]